MGSTANAERRDVPRRPFRGTVELGLREEVDGYEADAVDLSIGGMALKTSLLPDLRSELECKFSLDDGTSIAARGEVVWAQDAGIDAGAFGLRFTELAVADEQAIRRFVENSARALVQQPAEPFAPAETDPRARLHIAGMDAPLRAKVRTEMHDLVVLGSDLSFLKLGGRVEVERGNRRVPGAIEDVSVEVDETTRIARLVLTVAFDHAVDAVAQPAAIPLAIVTPPRAVTGHTGDTMPYQALKRPAQATAVLSPQVELSATESEISAPPPEAMRSSDADGVGAHDAMDANDAEAITSAQPDGRRSPPAWLVAALQSVRAVGRVIATRSGPAIRTGMVAIVAMFAWCVRMVRSRLARSATVAAPSRAVAAPGMRKQQSVLVPNGAAEPAAGPAPARKFGLYALAAVGAVAIVFALATGSREPRPRTPRPQVAVAAPAPEAIEPALAATAEPAMADPGAPADIAAAGEPAPEAIEPARAGARPAVARGAIDTGRRMPTDLVAASRSRNADVNDAPPSIRVGGPVPRGGNANATTARSATAAHAAVVPVTLAHAAPAATTRTLGSPTVRGGTILRLRMDGPVTAISGGAGANNTLTIRMSGRRSVDMAAPLVRQDSRLVNAGVFNRAGGAELTLRFREATPAFFAHVRGNTLEITLAAPVRRAAVMPVRAAVSRRPIASASARTVTRRR